MILFLTILKYWLLLGVMVHLFRSLFWIADGLSLRYIWLTFIPEFANILLINIFLKKFKKIKIQDKQYILRHINTRDNRYQLEFTDAQSNSIYSQPAPTIREALLNSLVMISSLSKKNSAPVSHNLKYIRSKL